MSAHGCWVSMKKKRESPEEEFKDEIQCGAGCWGHLMLAMYQVSSFLVYKYLHNRVLRECEIKEKSMLHDRPVQVPVC